MLQFLAGFASSAFLALAAFALGVVELTPTTADKGPCLGRCGEGTHCEQKNCIPDNLAPAEAETPERPARKRRRRRGRTKRTEASDPGNSSSQDSGTKFVPIDDAHIPSLGQAGTRSIDLDAGSERLSDRVIRRELFSLDAEFQQCIETAARHSEAELASGQISYDLEISSSGKVRAVDISVPKRLRVFSLPACVRTAIYQHRFPEFDGPTMRAEGNFRVE
jgi:hypothetical protein